MTELRKIPNVGKQTEQALVAMGYTTMASLSGKKQKNYMKRNVVCAVVLSTGVSCICTAQWSIS